MYRLRKISIWVGFAISMFAFGYCVLGVLMTAWITATPGKHDIELLEFKAYLWMVAAFFFICVAFVFAYLGFKKK